jgi:hypothetical protein
MVSELKHVAVVVIDCELPHAVFEVLDRIVRLKEADMAVATTVTTVTVSSYLSGLKIFLPENRCGTLSCVIRIECWGDPYSLPNLFIRCADSLRQR